MSIKQLRRIQVSWNNTYFIQLHQESWFKTQIEIEHSEFTRNTSAIVKYFRSYELDVLLWLLLASLYLTEICTLADKASYILNVFHPKSSCIIALFLSSEIICTVKIERSKEPESYSAKNVLHLFKNMVHCVIWFDGCYTTSEATFFFPHLLWHIKMQCTDCWSKFRVYRYKIVSRVWLNGRI